MARRFEEDDTSEQTAKTTKNPGPAIRCGWCYKYVGDRLDRHHRVCPACPVNEARREECGVVERYAIKKARRIIPDNMFVVPESYEDRSYSKDEVLGILEYWGHCILPLGTGLHLEAKPTNYRPHEYLQMPLVREKPGANLEPALLDKRSLLLNCALSPLPGTSRTVLPAPRRSSGLATATATAAASTPSVIEDLYEEEELQVFRPRHGTKRMLNGSDDDSDSGLTAAPMSVDSTDVEFSDSESEAEGWEPVTYPTNARTSLKNASWYGLPAEFTEHSIFKKFKSWYKEQGKKYKLREDYSKKVMRFGRFVTLCQPGATDFKTQYMTNKQYKRFNQELTVLHGADVQTVLNYCKPLKHFVKFLLTDSAVNLKGTDRAEYERLGLFANDVNNAMQDMSARVTEATRAKKAKKRMPPNLHQVTEILDVCAGIFDIHLHKAVNGTLTKYEVSFLNKYICAYICLFQSHRPGVATNMTASEYNFATLHPETSGHTVITVAKHNYDVTCDAKIVLNKYWTNAFSVYFRYVRESIIQRTKSKKPNFLLTYDGRPFIKVSGGIRRLQSQFSLAHHTPSDARKASETYAQGLVKEDVDKVGVFLCNSDMVQKTQYRIAANSQAVDAIGVLTGLKKFHKEHPNLATAIPTAEDVAAKRQKTDHISEPVPSTSKDVEPTQEASEASDDDDDLENHEEQTAAASTSPVITPKKERLDRIIKQITETVGGDLTLATLPQPNQIIMMEKAYGKKVSREDAVKLNRVLRHKLHVFLASEVAEKVLRREAKKRKTKIELLKELPEVQEADLTNNSKCLKLKPAMITTAMKNIMTVHTYENK